MGSVLSFVNAGMLWGGLLVASPILIHLLSRRRFRRVTWAAMAFLLEAERQNRRRVRLENLILLLLRCLAVILLALLLARPLYDPSGLGEFFSASSRVERIVILDDSPSMDARAGGASAFDRAREALGAMIARLGRERPGDSLTLLRASAPDKPLVRGRYLGGRDGRDIGAYLKAMKPSSVTARWDRALLRAKSFLEEESGAANRMVYLVSDFQARDWPTPSDDKGSVRLADLVADLAVGSRAVLLSDMGREAGANLTVSAVTLGDKALVAGVPARFVVDVRNHGPDPARDVVVTFVPAGATPREGRIGSIPPWQSATVDFGFTFAEEGPARIRVEIGEDVLPADNVRHFAASVEKGIPVLLVSGASSAEWGEGETFFLERALAPGGEVKSGFIVDVVSPEQAETVPLETVKAVGLCNLYQLPPEWTRTLMAWVEKGGGLLIFAGDQVTPAGYEIRAAADEDAYLLPVEIGPAADAGGPGEWRGLDLGAPNHPVLRAFRGQNNPFLARVKIFRWNRLRLPETTPSDQRSRVLLTLDDVDATPFMVDSAYGKGRVLTVAAAADTDGSNWPSDPSYVVTMQEALRYVARRSEADWSVPAGEAIRVRLDPAEYDGTVRVRPPGGAEDDILQAAPEAEGADLLARYDGAAATGIYRVTLTRHAGEREHRFCAVTIDPDEGDLRRLPERAMRDLAEPENVHWIRNELEAEEAAASRRIELWRPLLLALLGVLLAEQGLAWWFGRRR